MLGGETEKPLKLIASLPPFQPVLEEIPYLIDAFSYTA